MSAGRSRRTSGSPPVIRSLWTPSPTKIDARRAISSNDRTSSRGQEREVAPEHLGRHAVRAAEVAPVRDRDPEVAQRAPEAIGQPGAAVEVGGERRAPGSGRPTAQCSTVRSGAATDAELGSSIHALPW